MAISLFRQLKAEAEARARGALERVGIAVPDSGIEDDEDTAERDVFEIYQDMAARRVAMTFVDMPEGERELWLERGRALAADNAEALGEFEAWVAGRAAFVEAWNAKVRPRERLDYAFGGWDELLSLSATLGLLAAYEAAWGFGDFEQALSSLARAKHLPYANLLAQACRKLALDDALGLEAWVSALNTRLEPFDLVVELISHSPDKRYLSLTAT